MIIEWLASSLPLADTEVSYWSTLLSQIWLWVRVALGIGLVIFVHELGHFLAAKTFGVKCEKFYVGFDVPIRIGPIKFPRTLGKFTYGETEYGIGILPLGGYVKMLGQDDDPRKAQEEADRIKLEGGNEDDVEVALDPRSYPAKPVWQRMVIISAGVIMNVITGVLFAAIAFGYGVTYTPAIVGGVTPGGPAWKAGIEPGGRVIGVGEYKDPKMHFREMRLEILTAGLDSPDQPVDLAIEYDDGVRHYQLVTAPHPEDEDIRMIGITSPTSPKLSKQIYASPGSVAANVLTELDSGARIVAFDSNPIDADAIVPGTPLFDYLNSNPTKTIRLDLERLDGTKHTIELPPQKSRSIGLRFAMGPIVSVVDNGPAAKAGIQVGDVIESINGTDAIDAFGFPIDVTTATGPIQLTLSRVQGDQSETYEVELTPAKSPQTLEPTSGMGGEIAINTLGLAYRASKTISEVLTESDSDASPLAVLKPGDVVQEVHLVLNEDLADPTKHDLREEVLEKLRDYKFDKPSSLTSFINAIQHLPVGSKFVVLAERPPENTIIETSVVVTEDSRVQFSRGMGWVAAEQLQTADSFGHALALGWREGKRRLNDVFRFLGMMVRGRVKGKQVGGPIRIVQIAGMEAERGISPQLLFLTMLSMNLAILNFLPIPALDGGHMVFLIAEAIRGKRVDEQLEMRLTLAGVLALLALMVVVFFNDIINI
ncbi:MAG: PDZ domain-containing protein [Pirellulaceae bacterium]|nr:PDZ domain-containing protein [Pirellulaceae bacterium]